MISGKDKKEVMRLSWKIRVFMEGRQSLYVYLWRS